MDSCPLLQPETQRLAEQYSLFQPLVARIWLYDWFPLRHLEDWGRQYHQWNLSIHSLRKRVQNMPSKVVHWRARVHTRVYNQQKKLVHCLRPQTGADSLPREFFKQKLDPRIGEHIPRLESMGWASRSQFHQSKAEWDTYWGGLWDQPDLSFPDYSADPCYAGL
jgi:hypothetical protein